MIPKQLMDEVAHLEKVGYNIITEVEGDKVYIVIKNYILPQNVYNKEKTDILIWTTCRYPSTNFDMFWTDKDLLLSNGIVPRSAQATQRFLGVDMRRFSIHPYNAKPWNPLEDNLLTYLSYIKQRIEEGV